VTADTSPPLEFSPALKTSDLQALLAQRYPGDRYALFFDVPDDVGMHARRRCDAVAVGCWNSVGNLVDGFELKVSRSDWLRELKQVDKADPFLERCDRWWLVTASPAIAKLEEIPASWGWMAATKAGLRIQKPAPKLRDPLDTVPRLFLIAILRKFRDGLLNSPEVRLVIERMTAERDAEIERRVEIVTRNANYEGKRALEKVASFEKDTGCDLDDWRMRARLKVAKALVDLDHDDGLNGVARAFEAQQRTLENLLECVKLARLELGRKIEPPAPKEPT